MGIITRTTFLTGDVPSAAEWNTQFDTVYNVVNGNLDQNNIDETAIFIEWNVDDLTLNANILSSVSELNLVPAGGFAAVIDSHWSFDGTVMTAITNSNTTITAYVGKNITIESVIFDGGSVSGVTVLSVDNLTLDGNVLSSTAGHINISPVAGSSVVMDNYWSFDAANMYMAWDTNSTITAYAGKNIAIESVTFDGGVVAGIIDLTVDNLNLDGNVLSSTAGHINISPVAGSSVIMDNYWSFDAANMYMAWDTNSTITAYAGKNIAIESVTFDGGVVAGIIDLTVDNLNLDGNVLSSTAGHINISPVAGSSVVMDNYWSFDAADMYMAWDTNSTITAYAGKNIAIESVTFDGGVVAGIIDLTLDLSTEDLRFVDAGSAAATEQDWIEVTVGGTQGYIRVFAAK